MQHLPQNPESWDSNVLTTLDLFLTTIIVTDRVKFNIIYFISISVFLKYQNLDFRFWLNLWLLLLHCIQIVINCSFSSHSRKITVTRNSIFSSNIHKIYGFFSKVQQFYFIYICFCILISLSWINMVFLIFTLPYFIICHVSKNVIKRYSMKFILYAMWQIWQNF